MAHYNKIGLLVLNNDHTQLLVSEELEEENYALGSIYKMIGGKIEPGEDDISCLLREVKEETSCEIAQDNIVFIGEYIAPAASDPTKDVSIRLYQAELIGTPTSTEPDILGFVRTNAEAINNPKTSAIIKNKILPDLIQRGILK